MIDILGAAYDMVREFAWRNNDLPQLAEDQVLRGWQNSASLPPDSTEFCIISLLRTERHGKPANLPLATADDYSAQFFCVMEHVIQADFCGADPFEAAQAVKLRADLLCSVCHTPLACDFLRLISPDLTCLYADNPTDNSFLDMDKLYSVRYSVQMHLSEIQRTNFYLQPSFNSVQVRTGNDPRGLTAAVKNADRFFKP